MSKQKRARLRAILFLPIIALIILITFFLGSVVRSIPTRAEELFGAPDPELKTGRLYYHSLVLTWNAETLTSPTRSKGEMTTFEIQPGESPAAVIQRLHQNGLIEHPTLFRTFLVYSGIDTRIQAGEYQLSPRMSEMEIARSLENPAPGKTTLAILPGWRVEEIAHKLPGLGLTMSPQAFIQEVQRRDREGYLFPGTYQIRRDISPSQLVDTLSGAFQEHLTADIISGFNDQGLSIAEGIILASIVEKEAVLEDEMPQIASVFLNRLRLDMPLGADPTIQYALGYQENKRTWWKNPLTVQDFAVNSPFNTYQNKGLPPAPICNPGLKAIKAVAFPASTPYYYFSAACDGSGSHQFSTTFEEHQKNICP